MSAERGVRLANKLLSECRRHLQKHRLEPLVNTDPLFALSYVMAEFVAAASNDEAEIEEGLRINTEIVRARAIEALPEVIARRKGRMN